MQFPPYPNGINKVRLKGEAISCMRCTMSIKGDQRSLIQSLFFCFRSKEGLVCSKPSLVWSCLFFFYPVKAITLQALPHSYLLSQKMLLEHSSRYKTCKTLVTLSFNQFTFDLLHLLCFVSVPSSNHTILSPLIGVIPSQLRRKSRSLS